MASSRTDVSYMSLISEDVKSFDEVAKLYFEAWDNAGDEEVNDLPWDESDSGSESSQ